MLSIHIKHAFRHKSQVLRNLLLNRYLRFSKVHGFICKVGIAQLRFKGVIMQFEVIFIRKVQQYSSSPLSNNEKDIVARFYILKNYNFSFDFLMVSSCMHKSLL